MNDKKKQAVLASPVDRRRAVRHPTVLFVWYKILVEDPDPPEHFEGVSKTCDISSSGVGVFTAWLLPVGKKVFLEIVTKEFNLSAIGRVVYARKIKDGYFRVGIEFEVMPPNDRTLFDNYYKENE